MVDAAVARMQRHFERLQGEINGWRHREITDPDAKLLIYDVFVAARLAVPRRLIRRVLE